MRKFKHLTKTQRIQIETFLLAKIPVKKIAETLGVDNSTIYREKRRGEYQHKIMQYDYYGDVKGCKYETRYSSDIAHNKYRHNMECKGSELKIGNDYELAEFIERKIVDEHYSPLAVVGEIKKRGLQFNTTVCVNTIYNYIEKGVFSRLTLEHLPMKEKKKKKKREVVIKRAPRGTSIERRPLEIAMRYTFGHWEMDCVCGPTLPTLLVLTERLTRKEIIVPMKNQKSESVIAVLNSLERKYGKNFKKIFKSITVDNGSEFSNYAALETSIYGKGKSKRTKLYYCHPYCSSERGTNERINREIRRLIPKGNDLGKYTAEEIQHVENWVNNYPRQVLGFATSAELFKEYLVKAIA